MTLPIDARATPIRLPEAPAVSEGTPPRPAPPRPHEEGGFRDHLARAAARLSEGDAALDASMRRAMRGEGLDQGQLIALQSGVYRYSQEMELASRLVDRATQAVKQTLQSQT